MALPGPLLRYCFSFITVSGRDVIRLALVARLWRAVVCSQRGIAKCVVRLPLGQASFALLAGVETLELHKLDKAFTSSWFLHLQQLGSLHVGKLALACLDNSSFRHLGHVRELSLEVGAEAGATHHLFKHLTSLTKLRVRGDGADAILNTRALKYLRTVSHLDMSQLAGTRLGDEEFSKLKGLRTLNVQWCSSPGDAALSHLHKLRQLDISFCSHLTDAALIQLRHLRKLSMAGCSQHSITDAAFTNLGKLESLDMRFCDQPTITDAAFSHLSSLTALNMNTCGEGRVTDEGLRHLTKLRVLDLSECYQDTITDAVFSHLGNLRDLYLLGSDSPAISDSGLRRLAHLTRLEVSSRGKVTSTFSHLTQQE